MLSWLLMEMSKLETELRAASTLKSRDYLLVTSIKMAIVHLMIVHLMIVHLTIVHLTIVRLQQDFRMKEVPALSNHFLLPSGGTAYLRKKL